MRPFHTASHRIWQADDIIGKKCKITGQFSLYKAFDINPESYCAVQLKDRFSFDKEGYPKNYYVVEDTREEGRYYYLSFVKKDEFVIQDNKNSYDVFFITGAKKNQLEFMNIATYQRGEATGTFKKFVPKLIDQMLKQNYLPEVKIIRRE